MNEQIKFIQNIADKKLTYNKDINQHIGSCKISINIIRGKDEEIKLLRELVERKNNLIKELEEDNITLKREKFLIEAKRDIELKEIKEVITEQYKLINDLMEKINKN